MSKITPSQPDVYDLHRSIGYHMTVVARMIERRVEEGLRSVGLTRIEWCVLLAVVEEQCTRPSEIADFVGIDRTGTSRTLRKLEASGLVARSRGTGDGRERRVEATDQAKALLKKAVPIGKDSMAHFTQKLSDAESRELLRLLDKLKIGESGALARF